MSRIIKDFFFLTKTCRPSCWLVRRTLDRAVWVLVLAGVDVLGKTLKSHSASLHPGVRVEIGDLNVREQPCDGLASHLGEVKIRQVTEGSNADVIFLLNPRCFCRNSLLVTRGYYRSASSVFRGANFH